MSFTDMRRGFDHVGNYNFSVEIDGCTVGSFKAVDGLSAKVAVIDYQNGSDLVARKRPGRTTYGDITLKRGYVEDKSLYEWFMAVAKGKVQRKSVSIILLNNHGDEVVRYNLFEAWPSEWKGFSLDGKADDTSVEEIVFCVEAWERVTGEAFSTRTGVVR